MPEPITTTNLATGASPFTEDAEGLQNVSDKGKAPPSRIADYKAGLEIVKHLIKEDEDDRYDRINEQALVDGQGPFIQQELDESGQGWRQNNDWGGAASKFEQALAPYHDLLNGHTVELNPIVQGSAREEWSANIAEAWRILHERIWLNHSYQNHNLYRLFVGFGVGLADHEHPRDFRWRAGGLGEHYLPRPMQAYEDAANIHVRVREYREDELWEWYNMKGAAGVGWNLEEIKKAMLACNTKATSQKQDYWDGLTNNIYGTAYSRRATVKIFTLRSVELTESGDEKVSECMGMVDTGGEDFIYKSKKPQWIDGMHNCFTLFTAGIGNGDLHSIKGMIRKLFNTSQTENQFINLMFDFAKIYMSPMFESDSASAAQQLQTMQIGLFNLIPKGLKLVTATATPNYSQSILPLLGFSSQLGQTNSGIFQQFASPGGVEQTREEVVQRTMQNAILTSAAITLFSAAMERKDNCSMRRLISPDYRPGDPGYKERTAFFKECTNRGVPEEVIRQVSYIKPNRLVGGGDPRVGQMLLEKAQSLRPYLDAVGAKILDQMVATRLLGPDKSKSLIPSVGMVRTSDQQRFAMDENCWLKIGTRRVVLADDDHFLHAQVHDALLPDVESEFSAGGDPATGEAFAAPQMLAFLSQWIPHQKQHLQALAQNKPQAGAIGQFNLNVNKAVQTQEHLQNAIQAEKNRMAQQAQAQAAKQAEGTPPSGAGGPDPKVAAAALKSQIELRSQAALNQQELEHNDARFQQDLAQKAQEARQNSAIEDAQNASKILDTTPGAVVPTASAPLALPPPSSLPGPLAQP